jgi:hypothetical protein
MLLEPLGLGDDSDAAHHAEVDGDCFLTPLAAMPR